MRRKITCPCCGKNRASAISRFRHTLNEYLCEDCWAWARNIFLNDFKGIK